MELFGSRDEELVSQSASRGRKDIFPWFISFETLIGGTDFVDRMRDLRSLAFGAEWEEYMTVDANDDAQVG